MKRKSTTGALLLAFMMSGTLCSSLLGTTTIAGARKALGVSLVCI